MAQIDYPIRWLYIRSEMHVKMAPIDYPMRRIASLVDLGISDRISSESACASNQGFCRMHTGINTPESSRHFKRETFVTSCLLS